MGRGSRIPPCRSCYWHGRRHSGRTRHKGPLNIKVLRIVVLLRDAFGWISLFASWLGIQCQYEPSFPFFASAQCSDSEAIFTCYCSWALTSFGWCLRSCFGFESMINFDLYRNSSLGRPNSKHSLVAFGGPSIWLKTCYSFVLEAWSPISDPFIGQFGVIAALEATTCHWLIATRLGFVFIG